MVIPDPQGSQPDAAAGECMGYILVDRAKCQSCYTCMAACSLVNEGAAGFSYSRIQVSVDAFAKYPYDVQISQCRQCRDPQCVAACPAGAMHIDQEVFFMSGGYSGKIARINLTTGAVSLIDTAVYEAWGGGHGIAAALFYDILIKEKGLNLENMEP